MINQKLKEIAQTITEKNIIDVGTDHGYLIKELFDTGKINSALAVDVNIEPLNSSKSNLEKYKENVYFFQSDGLRDLEYHLLEKFDAVIIAGMGGELISKIMENSFDKLKNKKIYLQPSGSIEYLRNYLSGKVKFIDEKIIYDRKKFYELIICNINHESVKLSKEEKIFGPINLIKKERLLLEYWMEKLEHEQKILTNIPLGNKKREVVIDKIETIKKVLKPLIEEKEKNEIKKNN